MHFSHTHEEELLALEEEAGEDGSIATAFHNSDMNNDYTHNYPSHTGLDWTLCTLILLKRTELSRDQSYNARSKQGCHCASKVGADEGVADQEFTFEQEAEVAQVEEAAEEGGFIVIRFNPVMIPFNLSNQTFVFVLGLLQTRIALFSSQCPISRVKTK